MSGKELDSIYVIKNIHTGSFLAFKGKCAWISVSAAKNAYNHDGEIACHGLFDTQQDYVIVKWNKETTSCK